MLSQPTAVVRDPILRGSETQDNLADVAVTTRIEAYGGDDTIDYQGFADVVWGGAGLDVVKIDGLSSDYTLYKPFNFTTLTEIGSDNSL